MRFSGERSPSPAAGLTSLRSASRASNSPAEVMACADPTTGYFLAGAGVTAEGTLCRGGDDRGEIAVRASDDMNGQHLAHLVGRHATGVSRRLDRADVAAHDHRH